MEKTITEMITEFVEDEKRRRVLAEEVYTWATLVEFVMIVIEPKAWRWSVREIKEEDILNYLECIRRKFGKENPAGVERSMSTVKRFLKFLSEVGWIDKPLGDIWRLKDSEWRKEGVSEGEE
jgi:hypothetical protein